MLRIMVTVEDSDCVRVPRRFGGVRVCWRLMRTMQMRTRDAEKSDREAQRTDEDGTEHGWRMMAQAAALEPAAPDQEAAT